ncbi:MAG: hypothetical protein GYA24_08000, partial [Candidatus Lokiarchaeota archaeon]|nr:hypothetical protein [Candidatus Lokiarchaeota archaeon]
MPESPSPKPPRWPRFKKKDKKPINKRRAAIIWIIIIGAGALTPLLYFGIGRDHPLVIKAFSDPFVFNNGTRVADAAGWEARRVEIKALLLGTEYGTMPGPPDHVRVTETATTDLGGGRTLHAVTLTMIPDNATPSNAFNASAWIYVPNGTGPFPAVMKVGKDGDGFNVPAMDRGYVLACFNHKDLDPDTEGYDVVGPAQLAYPGYSWGSIAVWAWGAMRLADYLLGAPWVNATGAHVPSIDASVLAITGHSRTGKVALLAGGLDERFTMVVPNGSGCGGAGSFLVQGPAAETIALVTWEALYK